MKERRGLHPPVSSIKCRGGGSGALKKSPTNADPASGSPPWVPATLMHQQQRKFRLIRPRLQLRLMLSFLGVSVLALLLQYLVFIQVLSELSSELPHDGRTPGSPPLDPAPLIRAALSRHSLRGRARDPEDRRTAISLRDLLDGGPARRGARGMPPAQGGRPPRSLFPDQPSHLAPASAIP
jgi:hypothetical protein